MFIFFKNLTSVILGAIQGVWKNEQYIYEFSLVGEGGEIQLALLVNSEQKGFVSLEFSQTGVISILIDKKKIYEIASMQTNVDKEYIMKLRNGEDVIILTKN